MSDPLGPGGWAYWRKRFQLAWSDLTRLRTENERLRAELKERFDAHQELYRAACDFLPWTHPAMEKARELLTLIANQQSPICETCGDDPKECAKVAGLRHCEKANR